MLFARTITASLFAAVMAGTWDAWWHGALGRESFWSPPHMFLYGAILVAISVGWYGWYRTRDIVWKRLALLLLMIPISAPIDDAWHRFFGVENIASPLIVWSPPHLLLICAITASLIMLLSILRKDEIHAQRIFGSISFAAILALLLFVTGPFEPTGPHHLLGFLGAGIIAVMIAVIVLTAQGWIPGIASATLTVIFFLLLNSIGFGEKIALNVVVPPHDHPPAWLTVFAFFIPAVILDLAKRLPTWTKGAIVGCLWAGILFGVARYFFEPQFQYSAVHAFTAIVAGTIGGTIGGVIASRFIK